VKHEAWPGRRRAGTKPGLQMLPAHSSQGEDVGLAQRGEDTYLVRKATK
jgi:hypothetical protein